MQKLYNTTLSYGLLTKFTHWLMALTVLGMYPLGLYIGTLTYYDANYRTIPHWHKSIGILFGIILLLRLIWRISNIQPLPLATHSSFEKLIAKAMQWLLYCLMVLLVFSGYFISTADSRAIDVFNWFSIPALPWAINRQEDIAGLAHFWIATVLIVMVVIHLLAALKHHFIDKDLTLKRML